VYIVTEADCYVVLFILHYKFVRILYHFRLRRFGLRILQKIMRRVF